MGVAQTALSRVVRVDPGEVAASLWSFACFFCVLCGYYILRPLRDEMGVQGGVENLPWLFSATFAVMLAAVPLFGWAAARLPRRRLVPWTYLFFVANVLVFYALFESAFATPWVARCFFVWVSVFNLFVVSVFWSLMTDLFRPEQKDHRRNRQPRVDELGGARAGRLARGGGEDEGGGGRGQLRLPGCHGLSGRDAPSRSLHSCRGGSGCPDRWSG